jgi:predicted enzyme related to lactoylglutathione lyase
MFFRYDLRTKDLDAARAFYTEVFGSDFFGPDVSVSPLPARAVQAGAPPHWLGHLTVRDLEGTLARFVELGAQALGPTHRDGAPFAALRDPFGAVLALTSEEPAARRGPVSWHHLHCQDRERAMKTYGALFGWTPTELVDLGPELGDNQEFAWNDAKTTVGAMSSTVRLPFVHPQWLFFFPVDDAESTLARVRARGGKALEPIRSPRGIFAPCDDPQGGAFGVHQARA